jgi:chromosome segregation ATPase
MSMSPNDKKTILKKLHHTTKLELWQKVTDLQAKRMEAEDRAKELESDLETIREEFHSRVEKILNLEERIQAHEESERQLREALQSKTTDFNKMDEDRRMLCGQLELAKRDRDDWKNSFAEEQRANRKSKELLVRQAYLAGELAQLVTPANLRNNG